MDYSVHNKLVSFIWSIADDCLRDVYVRGKYRDVILPMIVLRRLDALLEPTKTAVMEEVCFQQEEVGMAVLDPAGLRDASGYVFYNTSEFTLARLAQTATNNRQILEANFQHYLDGFSDNVKEIINKFKLRGQIRHMAQKDVLLDVLEKFTSPYINLTPHEAFDPEGRKLPPLTNLGMGYVFEELIRRFNEENNEEAGEHFTPREVIKLMTHLVFEPVRERLPSVILVYDGACGSGGMLTEAQNFITDQNGNIRAKAGVHLYGIEVNDETYAICKSDMMIKGNDPEQIKNGSTLATDMFAGTRFDFMMSNPPYGKSWKSDLRYIKDGATVLDPRFEVQLNDFRGQVETVDATPRSSDGQLLFLMDMVSKMKAPQENQMGSRIASVHNGSSLFTGDAGSGESNIRRHIIENDWLEAIIQLPNNLFYNTGITTYIWLLSNNKPAHRRGWVQLIDASGLFRKLRKNLGAKNCELAPEHIETIIRLHQEMGESDISRLFRNEAFGYYKATVERPLRLAAQLSPERIAPLRFQPALQEPMAWAYAEWGEAIYTDLAQQQKAISQYLDRMEINLNPRSRKALLSSATWRDQRALLAAAERLMAELGQTVWLDYNELTTAIDAAIRAVGLKLSPGAKRQILNAVSWRDEWAAKVVKKVHPLSGKKLAALLAELGCAEADLPDFGYWPGEQAGEYVEYEPDSDLRDTENVPLTEEPDPQRAVHGYFLREVRPHVAEAWLDLSKTKIGYEISFNKYFYRHTPLRPLAEVTAEILQLEAETEGLLKKLVAFGEKR
jgi:type I restriction enzyme M protein